MNELDKVVDGLKQFGVSARVTTSTTADTGAAVTVSHGRSQATFDVITGDAVRGAVASGTGTALVCAPYISPRTAEAYRRTGVRFLDDAGNAWLTFGDVLIDVRGRPRLGGPRTAARASGNPFSNKRSQVALALLAWPGLWAATRRDVAHAAGVSVGMAHDSVRLLRESGFADDSRRSALLDMWAAAFQTGLGPRLDLANFRGESAEIATPRPHDVVSVSGPGAVPELLRSTTWTLYVADLDPKLAIVNRWRSDGEPNITVRRRFWTTPGTDREPAVAPWPLVYADLLASDDPRARDAAKEYRAAHE